MKNAERAEHIRRAEKSVRDAISSIFHAKLQRQQWHTASLDVKALRQIAGNLDEYADALEWNDDDGEEVS